MKNYRCIFNHGNGHTTVKVEAADAEAALKEALGTIDDRKSGVEVWDETGLVLQRAAEELPKIIPPPYLARHSPAGE